MHASTHIRRSLTFVLVMLSLSCSTAPKAPLAPVPAPKPQAEKPRATPGLPAKASIPPQRKNSVLLNHKYFEIQYDPSFRLARYVKYQLTKENLRGKRFKRKDRFRPDPQLTERKLPAVHPKEYAKSGYDKGHLAPAADFSWSEEASDLTFVMSNMVPQKPGLNRSAWKMLEDQVRKWACGEERIIVITGPILEAQLPSLPGGLAIPRQFFKIVIDDTPPRKALAFVYNQEDKGQVMHQRMVALNELEMRLQENFSALLQEERRPAQVAEWKECSH